MQKGGHRPYCLAEFCFICIKFVFSARIFYIQLVFIYIVDNTEDTPRIDTSKSSPITDKSVEFENRGKIVSGTSCEGNFVCCPSLCCPSFCSYEHIVCCHVCCQLQRDK